MLSGAVQGEAGVPFVLDERDRLRSGGAVDCLNRHASSS
jgi:hypothetical protein